MRRLALLAALVAAGCATQPTTSVSGSGSSLQQPQASAAVRDAQDRLRSLGFYDGPVDGLSGPETRLALERFQRSRGLDATGNLNAVTTAALRDNVRPAAPRLAAAAPPPAPLEATNVRALQNRLRQLGYYNGPVDGVWGSGTQVALERFQRRNGLEITGHLNASTASVLGLEPALGAQQASLAQPLEPAVVRSIQRRLGQLGFRAGGVDGIMGPGTMRAIERFQESRGLAVTGDLNPMTIAALGLDPNNLAESVAPRGGAYGGGMRR